MSRNLGLIGIFLEAGLGYGLGEESIQHCLNQLVKVNINSEVRLMAWTIALIRCEWHSTF